MSLLQAIAIVLIIVVTLVVLQLLYIRVKYADIFDTFHDKNYYGHTLDVWKLAIACERPSLWPLLYCGQEAPPAGLACPYIAFLRKLHKT